MAQRRVAVAFVQLPARRLAADAQGESAAAAPGNATMMGKVLAQYTIDVAGLGGAGRVVKALSHLEAGQMTQMFGAMFEQAGHHDLAQAYSANITQTTFLGGAAGHDASSSGGMCSDFPAAWTGKNSKYACVDYVAQSWCTPTGGYGTAWDQKWGSFADWGSAGFSAAEACCGCGGGEDASTNESDMGLDEAIFDGLVGAGGGVLLALLFGTVWWCCCRTPPGSSGTAQGEAPQDLEASPHAGSGTLAGEPLDGASSPERYYIGTKGPNATSQSAPLAGVTGTWGQGGTRSSQ